MTTILWGNHGVVLIDYPEKDKSLTEAYYAPLIHIKIKISKIKITKANVAIAGWSAQEVVRLSPYYEWIFICFSCL